MSLFVYLYYFLILANIYASGLSVQDQESNVFTIQAIHDELPPTDGSVQLTKDQVSQHLNLTKSKNLTITCPELQNTTFTNDPPFEVLGIPECAGYVKPKLVLFLPATNKVNASNCSLEPLDLPNNITTACFDQLNERTDVKKVVIIIHGFLNGFSSGWLHEMQEDIQKVDPNTAVIVRIYLLISWPNANEVYHIQPCLVFVKTG